MIQLLKYAFLIPYVLMAVAIVSGYVVYFRPWYVAYRMAGKISFIEIVMAYKRGNSVNLLIETYCRLYQSNTDVTFNAVERFYMIHHTDITSADDLVAVINEYFRDHETIGNL